MKSMIRSMPLAVLAATLAVAGCAGPPRARPGDTAAELTKTLAAPDARVKLADGGERWQYPTGPMGVEAWMIDFGPDGRVQRVTNALTVENIFASLRPGMTMDEVRATFGRPAIETRYVNLGQDVWTWRYFDLGDLNPFRQLDVFFAVDSGRLVSYTMTPDRAFDPGGGGDRP